MGFSTRWARGSFPRDCSFHFNMAWDSLPMWHEIPFQYGMGFPTQVAWDILPIWLGIPYHDAMWFPVHIPLGYRNHLPRAFLLHVLDFCVILVYESYLSFHVYK